MSQKSVLGTSVIIKNNVHNGLKRKINSKYEVLIRFENVNSFIFKMTEDVI
jgi:hypothetical protein